MKRLAPLLVVTLAACVAPSPPSDPTSPQPPAQTGTRYVKRQAPCALDSDAIVQVYGALKSQAADALLQGLFERGKVVALAPGTKFEVIDDRNGYSQGLVRSGREIGRDCYTLTSYLRDAPADTKK